MLMLLKSTMVMAIILFSYSGSAFAEGSDSTCTAQRALPFTGDPNQYDPQVGPSTISGIVFQETMDTLLIARNDGTLIPMLAENFEIDAVGNSIIFDLDSSCGWSDGTPITAADYVLSFRRLLSMKSNIDRLPIGGILGAREIASGAKSLNELGVVAEDEFRLRIDMIESPVELLGTLGTSEYAPMPSHLMDLNDDFSPLEISSGAFMAEGFDENYINLVRNPYHCRKIDSNIEAVRLLNISNKFEEFSLMARGELDVMLFPPEQQLAQAAQGGELLYRSVDEPQHRQVNLQITPATIPDIDIRRAISLSIDRPALAERGDLETTTRIIADSIFHQIAGYEGISFDAFLQDSMADSDRLLEAQRIMSEKGYSHDNPYKATISTYPLEIFSSAARFTAGMLHRSYFDVTYVEQETVADAILYQSSPSIELFIVSWNLDYPHPKNSVFGFYQSTQMNDKLLIHGRANQNAEDARLRIEEALQRASVAGSREEQYSMLSAAENEILGLYLMVPLFNPIGSYIISNSMHSDADHIYLRMADYNKSSCEDN